MKSLVNTQTNSGYGRVSLSLTELEAKEIYQKLPQEGLIDFKNHLSRCIDAIDAAYDKRVIKIED